MIVESPAVAWFVSAVLIVAAVIDGRQQRVPNWLTYPLALAGLIVAASCGPAHAWVESLKGLGFGLVLLLPLYAIGGMGAGDVKLWAALGAWTGWMLLGWATIAGVLAGGAIALVMIVRSGRIFWHIANAHTIVHEILTIRDPVQLSARAAARKPMMSLLPYGIPLTIGSLLVFACRGLLL